MLSLIILWDIFNIWYLIPLNELQDQDVVQKNSQQTKRQDKTAHKKYENKLASNVKGFDIESSLLEMLFTLNWKHNESKIAANPLVEKT